MIEDPFSMQAPRGCIYIVINITTMRNMEKSSQEPSQTNDNVHTPAPAYIDGSKQLHEQKCKLGRNSFAIFYPVI